MVRTLSLHDVALLQTQIYLHWRNGPLARKARGSSHCKATQNTCKRLRSPLPTPAETSGSRSWKGRGISLWRLSPHDAISPPRKVRRGQNKPWAQPSDWCWDRMPDIKTVDTKQKERGERQNATEIKDSPCLRIGGDSEDFPFLLCCIRQLLAE